MAKTTMTAERMYEQSIDEVVESILSNPKGTMLVRGHMGSGKSSILKILASKLPTHIPAISMAQLKTWVICIYRRFLTWVMMPSLSALYLTRSSACT